MVGRLALGFVPKVHATEAGVHYQYPSIAGSSRTFSKGQVATVHGDTLRIEKKGILDTSEGKFEAVYSADFKLLQVYELNEERIRIQVVDQSGKVIPVEFKRVEREFGPEIEVVCDDHQIAAYWNRVIRPAEDLPLIDSSNALNCPTSLALGAVGALSAQNVLPLVIGTFLCLNVVKADDGRSTSTPYQSTELPFNVRDPNTFVGKRLTFEQAVERLKILEERSLPLNEKDAREMKELSSELFKESNEKEILIKRTDGLEFYFVDISNDLSIILRERMRKIGTSIEKLTSHRYPLCHSPSPWEKGTTSASYTQFKKGRIFSSIMDQDFFSALRNSYVAYLQLQAVVTSFGERAKIADDIYSSVTSLLISTYGEHKELNRQSEILTAAYLANSQIFLETIRDLIIWRCDKFKCELLPPTPDSLQDIGKEVIHLTGESIKFDKVLKAYAEIFFKKIQSNKIDLDLCISMLITELDKENKVPQASKNQATSSISDAEKKNTIADQMREALLALHTIKATIASFKLE